jgi:hypothetical protein
MNGVIRGIAGALVLTAIMVVPAPERAYAGDTGDVLVDGFYGGLIGALVGAGVMVLTDDPGDHLQYMATGAGIGVIAGTLYGLSKLARHAMIDVDQGRVAWHVPRIEPVMGLGADGDPEVTVSADLLRVRF